MSFQCPNCGAGLEGTERFCRKCGSRILPEDLTEATTRSFDDPSVPPPPGAPTGYRPSAGAESSPMTPRPTQHADYVPPHYGAPTGGVPPGVPAYQPGGPVVAKKKRNWALILGIAAACLILFCGTGGYLLFSAWQSVSGPNFEVGSPDGDRVVVNPSADRVPEELQQWVYPGSDIRTFVHEARSGNLVLVLSTNDDVNKVAEYYRQFKPSQGRVMEQKEGNGQATNLIYGNVVINIVRPPVFDQGTVVNVVVEGGGDGSGEEGDPDADADPDPDADGDVPPPVPTPPPPPPPPPRPGR
jgi:hypothetical protein